MALFNLLASLLPILNPGNDGRINRRVDVQVTPIVHAPKDVTVTVTPVINVNISVAIGSDANASIKPETKKQSKKRKATPAAASPRRDADRR
jgi:hypothetical protein